MSQQLNVHKIFLSLKNILLKYNLAYYNKGKLTLIKDGFNSLFLENDKLICNCHFFRDLFQPLFRNGDLDYLSTICTQKEFVNELNSLYLYKKYIPFKIKKVPTNFGVAISLEDLKIINITLYIGQRDNNIMNIIKNDDLLIELAKDFIFDDKLYIIDYIIDKDWDISKIF